jgi:hypothetical protein
MLISKHFVGIHRPSAFRVGGWVNCQIKARPDPEFLLEAQSALQRCLMQTLPKSHVFRKALKEVRSVQDVSLFRILIHVIPIPVIGVLNK